MLDPFKLLTETIIPVLRSVPELLATVDENPEAITAYVHSYPASMNLFDAIPRMETPSILVAHRQTNVVGVHGNGIEHAYSVFLRPNGGLGPMFLALRDGIPAQVRTAAGLVASANVKLKLVTMHYKCRPPLMTALNYQTMLLSESQFIEYHEVPLVLAERGLDN